MNIRVIIATAIPFIFASCNFSKSNPGENKTGIYKNAAVVCAYPDAAKVGVDILKKGGNAVDAAVAVSFALAVVYPDAGNIGGGGFMVLRFSNGETNALDYREKAPSYSTRDMYLDKNGNVIESASLDGHLASGVPGTVDGLFRAHQRYGKLTWKDLLQPAIDLAHNGFCLTKRTAKEFNEQQNDFKKFNPLNSYLQKDFWKEGDTVLQPDLAKTLELIRDKGRDGFYTGTVADLIVDEMQRGKGLITHDDLNNYSSVWRKPIEGNYRGYHIITMPPPSSGGIVLMQLLKMVEPYDLAEMGFHTAKSIHLYTEAENRAFADRAKWMGDPDFFNVPVKQLTDSVYIVHRMRDYKTDVSTTASQIKAGEITVTEKEETTHFSIVDKDGNAAAVTTTLNGAYGSRVFVTGAGFLLNNEMDDFSIKPGVPNAYGLVGGDANAIEPNKRMLSSMAPTIITKNNKLFMVIGTPGGSTIITTVFQNIINVIDFGMNIQQAIDSKRIHSQWLPDTIKIEHDALDTSVILQLKSMGYNIKEREPIGRCDAILVLPDGTYQTAADKRGDDFADGY